MGRREGYANPVAIASFSMYPVQIEWLNGYALKHKTSKSWIVRKALLDFQEKHDPEPTGAPEGFWQCPACDLPTANSNDANTCWRDDCKGTKP